MAPARRTPSAPKVSATLFGSLLLAAGIPTLALGIANPAGADNSGSPVCGPSVTITSNDTATSPLMLTVPQYNGTGTLTSAEISIQPTENFSGEFLNSSFQPFPGTATVDYNAISTVLEATATGLSPLAAVTVGAPVNGSPNAWTAGAPLPALPSGVAGAEGTAGAGVSTTSATDPSWSALSGFTFTPNSPAPATDHGSVTFTPTSVSVPAGSFGNYEGNGNVSVEAADYDEATSASNSTGFTGINDATSVEACATYTVLGAATPEAPSAIMLPAGATVVGLGVFLIVRRRNRKANVA